VCFVESNCEEWEMLRIGNVKNKYLGMLLVVLLLSVTNLSAAWKQVSYSAGVGPGKSATVYDTNGGECLLPGEQVAIKITGYIPNTMRRRGGFVIRTTTTMSGNQPLTTTNVNLYGTHYGRRGRWGGTNWAVTKYFTLNDHAHSGITYFRHSATDIRYWTGTKTVNFTLASASTTLCSG